MTATKLLACSLVTIFAATCILLDSGNSVTQIASEEASHLVGGDLCEWMWKVPCGDLETDKKPPNGDPCKAGKCWVTDFPGEDYEQKKRQFITRFNCDQTTRYCGVRFGTIPCSKSPGQK